MFLRPFKDSSSITVKHPITLAPQLFSKCMAAVIEPPVAIRSSTIRHFKPGRIVFFWISKTSWKYKKERLLSLSQIKRIICIIICFCLIFKSKWRITVGYFFWLKQTHKISWLKCQLYRTTNFLFCFVNILKTMYVIGWM